MHWSSESNTSKKAEVVNCVHYCWEDEQGKGNWIWQERGLWWSSEESFQQTDKDTDLIGFGSRWNLSYLTRDQTHAPCIGSVEFNHWATREMIAPTPCLWLKYNLAFIWGHCFPHIWREQWPLSIVWGELGFLDTAYDLSWTIDSLFMMNKTLFSYESCPESF